MAFEGFAESRSPTPSADASRQSTIRTSKASAGRLRQTARFNKCGAWFRSSTISWSPSLSPQRSQPANDCRTLHGGLSQST
jgi:hypothetical protein